jgi:hypothetical protein
VHLTDRLWVHIPIEPSLEKKVLQDENLDSELIEKVSESEENDGVKLAKLEVKSIDSIDQVMSLLKLKHAALVA